MKTLLSVLVLVLLCIYIDSSASDEKSYGQRKNYKKAKQRQCYGATSGKKMKKKKKYAMKQFRKYTSSSDATQCSMSSLDLSICVSPPKKHNLLFVKKSQAIREPNLPVASSYVADDKSVLSSR
jgi:uncharacterized protein YxeA